MFVSESNQFGFELLYSLNLNKVNFSRSFETVVLKKKIGLKGGNLE